MCVKGVIYKEWRLWPEGHRGLIKPTFVSRFFFWEIEDGEDEGSVGAVAVMSEKKGHGKDLGSRKVTRLPRERVGREREEGQG